MVAAESLNPSHAVILGEAKNRGSILDQRFDGNELEMFASLNVTVPFMRSKILRDG
jgi:hypothetical protein